MKNEEIKKAVSEIDDKFIMEADPAKNHKYGSLLWRKRLQAGLTAAAVLAVAVLGGVTWKQSHISKQSADVAVAYEDATSTVEFSDAETDSAFESTDAGNNEPDGSDTTTAGSDSSEKKDTDKDDSDSSSNDSLTLAGNTDDSPAETGNTSNDTLNTSKDADTTSKDSGNTSENSGNTSENSGNTSEKNEKTNDSSVSGSNDGNSSNTAASSDDKNSTPFVGTTGSSSGKDKKKIEISSIGPYDQASSYEEVYDILSERYSGRYYDNEYDDLVMNEEADGAAGSSAKEASGAPAMYEESTTDTASDSGSGSSSPDHSDTNVMHEGVDEGDIAKTDGKYIYLVENDCVSITDIRSGKPGKKTKIDASDDDADYYYQEMYIHGDTLVIIATAYSYATYEYEDDYNWIDYGFKTFSRYDTTVETVALCYDVSDRQNAKLMGKVSQDGYYNTSRLIGDKMYLFTNFDMYRPDRFTKEEALDDVSVFVPCINDEPIDYRDIYIKDTNYSSCVISSFDIDECEDIIDSKTVVNGYGSIYVSSEAIYFYETDYSYNRNNYRIKTNIGKIGLDDGYMIGGGATALSGGIGDSFAIHEIDGNLMVLATDYKNNSPVSTLYMLGPDMSTLGKVGNIAKDEYVYAARYLGDYVYFITYRSIDPMFVCDISDPKNPKLLGEVEIQGYSDYLHMWDENHVLGLGFETVDNGYGGEMREGVKLVMFDVTDPLNPVIENTLVLKDEDYSNAISYNYKALLVSPGKNLIGFGAEDYDKDYNEWYSYYLFSYSSEKGFKVVLDTTLDSSDYNCRGLYSGDNFYIVNAYEGEIKHFGLKNNR